MRDIEANVLGPFLLRHPSLVSFSSFDGESDDYGFTEDTLPNVTHLDGNNVFLTDLCDAWNQPHKNVTKLRGENGMGPRRTERYIESILPKLPGLKYLHIVCGGSTSLVTSKWLAAVGKACSVLRYFETEFAYWEGPLVC